MPVPARRSYAVRPCSRQPATIRSRTALAGSEASRQSLTATISYQRPGAWKPHTRPPSESVPNEYSSLLRYRHCSHRGNDRLDREALQLADPRQRVGHLLGLDLQLALVAEHLPRRARMVGDRFDPVGSGREDLGHPGLGVGALALADDGPHPVARQAPGDEHDVVVQPGDARAAVGERVDRQLELVTSLRPRRVVVVGAVSIDLAWQPAGAGRPPTADRGPAELERLLDHADDRLAVGVLALVGQYLAQLGLRQLLEPRLDLRDVQVGIAADRKA